MNEQGNGFLEGIKLWHVAALLIGQIVAFAVGWGAMSQRVADLQDRVVRIENSNGISRQEFDAWKTDMKDRLDTIEQEILDSRRLQGVTK